MAMQCAPVFPIFWVVLQHAGLSVLSVLSVLRIKLASHRNVKILVLGPVVLMPDVRLLITTLSAAVHHVIQAIHLSSA